MAPHKTPRNKKQQNVFSPIGNNGAGPKSPTQDSLPMRPSLVSQPSETYEAAQEDEREVLKAIFMEDYEETEPKQAWGKYSDREIRLKLKSFSNEAISVVLSAKLTATYPKSLPTLSVEGVTSLRKRTQERIQHTLKSKPAELVGEVMLHEIATEIQDALEDEVAVRETDGTFENLGAERAVQEAAAVELAKQHEEDQRRGEGRRGAYVTADGQRRNETEGCHGEAQEQQDLSHHADILLPDGQ
jgi:translation initiation factor 2-alpha kinase 4